MSFDIDRLYSLLPAVYRLRDVELARRQGLDGNQGPLRALLRVIAEQVAVLEEDMARLYDDLFIETCAEWVVPYIGELVGARGLFPFKNAAFSQRALVANTVADRRRKGTAAALEDLAFNVTGWQPSVVEYFKLLATTQYMKHLRPQNVMMPHLTKHAEALEYAATPFDASARTLEVRRIAARRGLYNIPNIGIFLWRLRDQPVSNAPAYRLSQHRFLFSALGYAAVLLTKAQPEGELTRVSTPLDVPIPISRRVFHRYRERYYGPDLSILVRRNGNQVLLDDIEVCNLSDIGPGAWTQAPGMKFLIDPELGRLLAPATLSAAETVHVSYRAGFSASMGGGEYGREPSFTPDLGPEVKVAAGSQIQPVLDTARGGPVEIDSNEYFLAPTALAVGHSQVLELRAADQKRPILLAAGDLLVSGAPESAAILNGLTLVGAAVRVPATLPDGQPNRLRTLRLRHCTLVPGDTPAFALPGGGALPQAIAAPRLIIEAAGVNVEIEDSIVGGILAPDVASVTIRASIVDASHEFAMAYAGLGLDNPGAPLQIENSTVIGKVHTLSLSASNTIFLADRADHDPREPVRAERLQDGCVRFSFIPPGSRIPRPYHCQPSNAGDAARVRPVFTSLTYGDAAYCQLSTHCATEITQGADDQAEMGVFHDLYQPQRISNFQTRLDEHLRFGLEAGVLLAN